MAWDDLTRLLGSRTGQLRTLERMKRTARQMTGCWRSSPECHVDPDLTLEGIARQLEDMGERTLRGRASFYPSSVQSLLLRAERPGLITA